MENFNQLNPAEAERLALLLEECAEVVQVVGKILRHGYESRHPNGGPTNRQLLCGEIGDVMAAKELMQDAGDVTTMEIVGAKVAKLEKVGRYLHHQPDRANTAVSNAEPKS